MFALPGPRSPRRRFDRHRGREREGPESELVKRLSGGTADRATGVTVEGGRTTRSSVDESGWIFETTHDENGQIVDENVVAAP